MDFKQFLKNRGVIAAMFMAIFYQVIFMVIYIPGYSAIPKNIDQMNVALVNEDSNYGETIAGQLSEELPFHVETGYSLEESRDMLNDRDLQLVIHIPSDFTANLTSGETQPGIDFYTNESNPTIITSTTQSVIDQVQAQLGEQFSISKAEGILANFNVPEDQASELAASIQNSLDVNTVTINEVPDGMHNQMAPMFLTLVSYVGAMIASLMLTGTFRDMKAKIGKWKSYLYMNIVTVMIAVIAPLIGISILFAIHGYGSTTFMHLWMHHALELFVALQFTSVFCLLAGQLGMILNLPIMLAQVIANGSVVTRDMMYGVYRAISYVSPMYYSVQSDYSIMFGGGKLASYEWHLALIGVAAIVINVLIVAVVHRKNQDTNKENVPSPAFI
ncbi:YhgE/Pip domain-containing protein [Radiobacillus sp. PE A8.2]|uniref:YhgE/Pip domain-containing protein n=1 Tax=Radiobacillus sp. PE A8.2 TaxID=3380349 RepID=UPI00388F5E9F